MSSHVELSALMQATCSLLPLCLFPEKIERTHKYWEVYLTKFEITRFTLRHLLGSVAERREMGLCVGASASERMQRKAGGDKGAIPAFQNPRVISVISEDGVERGFRGHEG